MADYISISGMIQGYDGHTIPGIQVSVYRDMQYLKSYYNYHEEGKYELFVLPGTPVTIRFDTHYSLSNAEEWHPLIVANIDAKKNIVLPRLFLSRVGQYESETAMINALTAYQFCAFWTTMNLDAEAAKEYAKTAWNRLNQLKFTLREHIEINQILIDFFRKTAGIT